MISTASSYPVRDDATYPPLPPITDPILARAAFTHISIAEALAQHTGAEVDSYKRLAYIGDSLLNAFVTFLIYAKHPKWSPQMATDARSNLVSRYANSRISRHCGLPERVVISASERGAFLSSDKECGEVWEAYLAALFLSYIGMKHHDDDDPAQGDMDDTRGLDDDDPTATQLETSDPVLDVNEMDRLNLLSHPEALNKLGHFLIPLYLPLIRDPTNPRRAEARALAELSKGAKNELNTLCGKWRIPPPVYRDEWLWPDWIEERERFGNQGKVHKGFCTVPFGGREIAKEGLGGNVSSAHNVAAYLVLQELKPLLL